MALLTILMAGEVYCDDHDIEMQDLSSCFANKVAGGLIGDVKFFDETGDGYNIKLFEGQIVIIYFWASWCPECVKELKSLDLLKSKLLYNNVQDVEIIPISSDFKKVHEVYSLYKKSSIKSLGLFLDPKKAAALILGVRHLPYTIILDKNLYKVCDFNQSINWNSSKVMSQLIKLRGGPVKKYEDLSVANDIDHEKLD